MNNRKRIDGEKIRCEAEDRALVERCLSEGELVWHHIIYLCNGGTDDDENIAVVCEGCHSEIHRTKGDWVEFGQKGGLKTLELYGPEHFKKLAQKRWQSNPKRIGKERRHPHESLSR